MPTPISLMKSGRFRNYSSMWLAPDASPAVYTKLLSPLGRPMVGGELAEMVDMGWDLDLGRTEETLEGIVIQVLGLAVGLTTASGVLKGRVWCLSRYEGRESRSGAEVDPGVWEVVERERGPGGDCDADDN